MVWEQVKAEVTRPHVAYAVTGFALILFGTISLFIKEKLYIGEATVATIYGLIVGPHCLNWFAPTTWGNSDYITLEISRIVLIVQIFAVAVELPKKYMLRHWWSVTMLLVPVMAYGWLITSVFVWKLVPSLRWIQALCIAGCVTATDPVLASAVVGKGKFARRVPGHLRNLLSAESGCNDGMAFPFVIMAIYILRDEHHPGEIARDFICIGVLYSCILGILIGAVIGYGARHIIKFAERFNLIDRESFLVYYFCVALFCAGVGTLCGVDDLLVAFAAGAAFSWDGWFAKQTEESHVSNVIDVLLNTAFFVYFGAIVPWPDFNNADLGIRAWKLVCLAIIVLVVRRIPIIMAIKVITPDIHTWREALFCGHFGPIGVGAIFMAILARAQLETDSETPLTHLPPRDSHNYFLLATMWPVTCFLVISSIIVHGSSIAVFTLGKRINNMAITMTYTSGGNEPSWLSRLPRRNTDGGNILQLQRMETEEPISKKLRRRQKKKKTGSPEEKHSIPGAAAAALGVHNDRPSDSPHADETIKLRLTMELSDEGVLEQTDDVRATAFENKNLDEINAYREGSHVVVEDDDGNVLHKFDIDDSHGEIVGQPRLQIVAPEDMEDEIEEEGMTESTPTSGEPGYDTSLESKNTDQTSPTDETPSEQAPSDARRQSTQRPRRQIPRMSRQRSQLPMPTSGERVYAYQIDDTVIVENEDGDIVRKYKYVGRGQSPQQESFNWKNYIPRFLRKKVGAGISAGSGEHSVAESDEEFKDVENSPEGHLVPTNEGLPLEFTASQAISVEDEHRVRKRLQAMLDAGKIYRRDSSLNTRHNSGLRIPAASLAANSTHNSTHSRAVSEDEDYATTDYDEDEEAEPETAVERHRRLAALGVEDDNNDEAAHDSPGRNYADEDEPRITFKLPERPT